MASAPAPGGLVPRLLYGLHGSLRDALHYAEDGSHAYVSGHALVLASPDGRAQRILPGTPDCEGISALALSPNRKLIAVAERADKAVLTVYDGVSLKRRKQLLAADTGSKEYVSLSFSPDGKLLLAQGGSPDWNLLLWAWEKSKLATSVRSTNMQGSPVVQASISPGEGSLVTVIGTGVLKMFKLTESALKPLPLNTNRRDSLSFTCQAWVPLEDRSDGIGVATGAAESGKPGTGAGGSSFGDRERQLLGTAGREVLLFEGTEPRATLAVGEGRSVESLAAHSKGFVAGLDRGIIALFDRDEREYYKLIRNFTTFDHPQRVRSLSISASEEQLALALHGGPAFTLAINNQELMKPDEMNFELLGAGVHTGAVTGLDVSVRRPLVATCSSDRSVRLWNYAERSCDLVKSYSEDVHSVAIHPSGLQLLVGFADKLRLMTILMDDLRTIKEVAIKACRDVAFSNGGHLFAATNGITLSLYSTYTCECLGNLRGHNGKVAIRFTRDAVSFNPHSWSVRAICWAANDASIVSAGADGAVYEWRLTDFKRDKENVLKGCSYGAIAMTADRRALIAAGTDRKVKELDDSGAGAGMQVSQELDAQVLVTALALPHGGKVLFAATDTGAVRCYKYPLTGEFYEVKVHEGPINRLRVSFDDCLLISAGEDGSIAVSDIRDKDLAKASTRQQLEKLPWAEEVLVSKAELEERRAHVAELEQKVAELTMQTEYQLRLKDLHVQERLKELTDKFTSESEAERQKFELLLRDKNEHELEYEDKLKQAEARHASQLSALDAQYQNKIMAEVERYQQLLQEKAALNERWDEQNELLVESHERVIAELAEEAEAKLAEEVLAAESLRQEKDTLEKEAIETKRQLEEDADREIEELKDKYEQRLAAEREACLRLKGENGIMRKKFQALHKDIEEQQEQLGVQHEQQKELYTTIKGLEKDINGLKREIRERDDTIGDKERRIYELKKKNQELEKFKFVLDYKIKELKKQIEPREVEVVEMRETIRAMDAELERYHKSNASLDLTIQHLRLRDRGLQSEVTAQRSDRADAETAMKRLQFEVTDLAQYLQDGKALKEKVKALYQHYCLDVSGAGSAPAATSRAATLSSHVADVPGLSPAADVNAEYVRQRSFLEKTIEGLKRKLAIDSEAHRANELRIMGHNVTLIRELNELRREVKTLQSAAQAGRSGTTSVAAGSSLRTRGQAGLRAGRGHGGLGASVPALKPAAQLHAEGLPQLQLQLQLQPQPQLHAQPQLQQELQAVNRELELQRELTAKAQAELAARGDKLKALQAALAAREAQPLAQPGRQGACASSGSLTIEHGAAKPAGAALDAGIHPGDQLELDGGCSAQQGVLLSA